MDVLFGVLIALVVIAAVSMITVFLLVRALFRRARRSRTIDRARLRSRVQWSWGPRHTLYALQLKLDEALDSGRAAIELSVHGNGRRGELPRLFRRIEEEGLAVQAQLRLMASETDAGTLSHELAAAGLAVEQVCDMIRELRASVADGLGTPTGEQLAALHAELDLEVAALHAGVVELAQLNGSHPGGAATNRYRTHDRSPNRGVQS